jgi:hypothetical protein
MQNNDFDAAVDNYDKAIQSILDGSETAGDELPPQYLAIQRQAALQAKFTGKSPGISPPAGSTSFNNPIDRAAGEKMVAELGPIGTSAERGMSGKTKRVGDYFLKVVDSTELPVENPEGFVEEMVDGEVVHHALSRLLGSNSPGMQVVCQRTADGVKKATFVYRVVDGQQLAKFNEGQIFCYGKELSEHRAIAVWIGDFDRKPDNYMVSSSGELVPIDGGSADPMGRRIDASVDKMGGRFGRDHWLSRSFKDDINAEYNGMLPPPIYELWKEPLIGGRKIYIAEQSLTYDAAEPMVRKIENFCKPENASELEQALTEGFQLAYPEHPEVVAQKVRDSLSMLQQRGKNLDTVMRGLNERTARPLPPASPTSRATPPRWLLRLIAEPLAMGPMRMFPDAPLPLAA